MPEHTDYHRIAISAGHPLAAEIARDVLRTGGNAIDAGIAATIALTVLKSEQVQLGGVAAMLVRSAADGRVYCIEGAGRWPFAADRSLFERSYRGRLPGGVLRSVVPAAPDAWIAALTRFGTRCFAELATPAYRLAEEGFPAHEDLASCSQQFARAYGRYPENERIWRPNGRPIEVGQCFRQSGLARTLSILIEADRTAGGDVDRLTGLRAVRAEFYEGYVADAMLRHSSNEGGWLSREDLAAHRTPIVLATSAPVFGGWVHCCGPWSQGPALTQALQIVDLARSQEGYTNEASFLHLLMEALKLALADREAFYGDPDFVDVPLNELLSPAYAAARAKLIDMDRAAPGLPPPGRPNGRNPLSGPLALRLPSSTVTPDTSYVMVADQMGNIFAASPSDTSHDAPAVPGLGFVISTRGGQSRVEADHPTAIAPGKRPRVSACPFMMETAQGYWIAGGGPGGDFQLQASALVLARHLVQGMDLQAAIVAPRAFTQSAPGSSAPHFCFPGQVLVEDAVPQADFDELLRRNHKAVRGSAEGISRPSLGLVMVREGDQQPLALGDPRRSSGQIEERAKPAQGAC